MRERERDYIRKRRKRDESIIKRAILIFLLGHFTYDFIDK